MQMSLGHREKVRQAAPVVRERRGQVERLVLVVFGAQMRVAGEVRAVGLGLGGAVGVVSLAALGGDHLARPVREMRRGCHRRRLYVLAQARAIRTE